MKTYKYVITSGWWCDNDESADRDVKFGSSELRKEDFFYHWYDSVKKYSSPARIIVIDSASPVKPDIEKLQDVHWISLSSNPGHSTRHTGKFSGVTYAHILGMTVALLEDMDYWVYIEQDALIKGDGIIEHAISKMEKPIMFGSGLGTPQPMQQSLMIMKKEIIASFIEKLVRIQAQDCVVSPEEKFAIAANPILSWVLPAFFKRYGDPGLSTKILRNLVFRFAASPVSGFQDIPFGYGRSRPIAFSDSYYYFQHATDDELNAFLCLSSK